MKSGWACVAMCGFLGACGDDGAKGGAGGAGGSGGAEGGATVTGTVTLTEFVPGGVPDGGTATPIAGAEVCIVVPAGGPCATTDAMGTASLEGAKNTEFALRISKAGYLTLNLQTKSGDTDATRNLTLVPDALATAFAGVVGVPWPDATNGVVSVGVGDGMVSTVGASVSITGSAAGPFYLSEAGVPDATLTATSGNGVAFFATVPVGDQTVSVTPPSGTCTVGFGWANGTPNQAKAMVEANALTSTSFACK